jgi:hypothetical protein
MKKSLKITLMSVMLVVMSVFAYAKLQTELVYFCNEGKGGTCVPRGDNNGFNCNRVESGGDCSGAHVQEV